MRSAFGEQFDLDNGQVFLNTATVGVPPQFEVVALRAAVADWASGVSSPVGFDPMVTRARQGFAELVGADIAHVAMTGSVSTMVGLIAAAIPDGSRVATAADEFTSVTYPFAVQRRGVTVTELPLGELEQRCGEFDIVAVSVVQSADGRVADLATLRESTRDRETIVLLDATQSAGWFDFAANDVSWADAVIAGGYKWLLAPRGIAWTVLSDRLAARLTPHYANWYSTDEPYANIYGLPVCLGSDARRFDTSPAWFSALGASLSLPWLASLDSAAVHAHTVGLANQLRAALGRPPEQSAIVSIDRPGAVAKLRDSTVQVTVRKGAVRVGFHLYNTEEDLAALLAVL
jgi:selenocysteine lyase/cysteine desulfurase